MCENSISTQVSPLNAHLLLKRHRFEDIFPFKLCYIYQSVTSLTYVFLPSALSAHNNIGVIIVRFERSVMSDLDKLLDQCG